MSHPRRLRGALSLFLDLGSDKRVHSPASREHARSRRSGFRGRAAPAALAGSAADAVISAAVPSGKSSRAAAPDRRQWQTVLGDALAGLEFGPVAARRYRHVEARSLSTGEMLVHVTGRTTSVFSGVTASSGWLTCPGPCGFRCDDPVHPLPDRPAVPVMPQPTMARAPHRRGRRRDGRCARAIPPRRRTRRARTRAGGWRNGADAPG